MPPNSGEGNKRRKNKVYADADVGSSSKAATSNEDGAKSRMELDDGCCGGQGSSSSSHTSLLAGVLAQNDLGSKASADTSDADLDSQETTFDSQETTFDSQPGTELDNGEVEVLEKNDELTMEEKQLGEGEMKAITPAEGKRPANHAPETFSLLL